MLSLVLDAFSTKFQGCNNVLSDTKSSQEARMWHFRKGDQLTRRYVTAQRPCMHACTESALRTDIKTILAQFRNPQS